jgi:hypothetical protein
MWRVYCLRNKTLQQLYFDCSKDVQHDVRELEDQLGGKLTNWDFVSHDLMCFDLDEHTDEKQAVADVDKYVAAPAPPGWEVVQ